MMLKPAKLERSNSFGDPIGVRLYPHQRAALDSWIVRQADPQMTTVQAVRTLLSQALGVSPTLD